MSFFRDSPVQASPAFRVCLPLSAAELWFLWSSVLQLSIGIALLWQELGVATLAGLGVLVLFMPLNLVLMTYLEKFEVSSFAFVDVFLVRWCGCQLYTAAHYTR